MGHLLIIGGSDAGISAALRAREIDPGAEVTVALADEFPNYSVCGLPFFISGEVPDPHLLAHRTAARIEREGIRLLLNHAAVSIHPSAKRVFLNSADSRPSEVGYDSLVIATGAVPVRPAFPGDDVGEVFLLRSMADGVAIHEHLSRHNPKSAVIIGGGYIGVEMADALIRRGLEVSLVERSASVLKTMDAGLGRLVGEELKRYGVRLYCGASVRQVRRAGDRLTVSAGPAELTADFVLASVGVRPASDLARQAGVAVGRSGAIVVSRGMETNLPSIYAAGDCVQTWHRLLQRNTYLPLGTTAHKQGRVAGENAAGGRREYAGTLGTQVVKVFELAVARTGLDDAEAMAGGFDPFTVETRVPDHKAYYPDSHELVVRVTGDRRNGRLLGAQMVGHWRAEVAKRIDVFATALFQGVSVDGLSDLDLSYTPPFSSPWDPVQTGAQLWTEDEPAARIASADAPSEGKGL